MTPGTQKRQRKAAADAITEANNFVGEAVTKAKRRAKAEAWPCTAEDLVRERDTKGQSWRAVAQACGLANPGQARKAYAELTGKSHKEAAPIRQRAKRGTGGKAVASSLNWDDDTDQAVIEAALLGHRDQDAKGNVTWRTKRLDVLRTRYGMEVVEEIECRYVTKFSYGPNGDQPLQVEFINDQGAFRTVYVNKIMKVVG